MDTKKDESRAAFSAQMSLNQVNEDIRAIRSVTARNRHLVEKYEREIADLSDPVYIANELEQCRIRLQHRCELLKEALAKERLYEEPQEKLRPLLIKQEKLLKKLRKIQ